MNDVQVAEQLWARAHDHVKRGDFAQGVRDLAQCFQLLQTHNDPRAYEVHRRWTEVHQLYIEDGQRDVAKTPAAAATNVQAEAEAAANAGDLARAVSLYENFLQQHGDNELVRERVAELLQAQRRADELLKTPAVVAVAEDDWSDLVVADIQPARPQPVPPTPPAAAPTMVPSDAPIGLPSLEVDVTVDGSEEMHATPTTEDLIELDPIGPSVTLAVSAAPTPSAAGRRDAQRATLEQLLSRVQQRRRPLAASARAG